MDHSQQNIYLKNEAWIGRPKPDQGMRHPPFMFSFIGRNGIFNTLDNPSSRICVPNKSKDIVVNVFYFDNKNKWIKNINKTYL